MKKLRLEYDQLAVESFATASAGDARATVRGHDAESTRVGACVYPSTSCAPGQTDGEYSCWCMYPNTDARVCCSDAGCSGGGMC